MAESFGMEA